MKKENGLKSLLNTLLTSGVAVVLSYLINFFLTPFVTNNIGTEAYGYITLAKTMVSYASIITVGFTAFMVRYITIEYHKNNIKESKAYFSSSVAVVVVITLVLLLVAGVGIAYIDKWLVIKHGMANAVRVLFFLVFLNFSFVTLAVPFTASCYIKNRLSIYNTLNSLSYIIQAIILYVMFKTLPTEIWYVGVGLLAAALVIFIGCVIATNRLTPDIKYDRNLVAFAKVKNLLNNGIWQSVNSLGTVLNSGLDLFITNQMLSGLAMGQLSIAKTIGTMFSVLYSTISQAFQPRMLKAYASSDKNSLFKELTYAMRVSGFFSGCGFAGFLALGLLYYKLWIPNQDYGFIFYLTIVTVLASTIEGVIYPAYFINTLTTRKMFPCFVTVISGVLNVVGMYFLIKYTGIGVYAVVWTTTVLSFIVNLLINPIYCSYTVNWPLLRLYPTVIKHLIGCVAMCVVFTLLTKIINPHGWMTLILTAFVCLFVGLILYSLIVTNGHEKRRIYHKLKGKLAINE